MGNIDFPSELYSNKDCSVEISDWLSQSSWS